VQPAGNHQVQHEPNVAIYADSDSFSNPSQFAHHPAFNTRERRLNRSQQKGTCESNALDRLPEYACFKCGEVGSDIRQFGHDYKFAAGSVALHDH
jgi:hypothetical protein